MRKLIALACLVALVTTAAAFSACRVQCCAKHASAACVHKSHHDAPVTTAKHATTIAKAIVVVHCAIAEVSQPSRITDVARTLRNVIAFGALRVDDDIGLHTLLATLLI
jgi:hypothetical protein